MLVRSLLPSRLPQPTVRCIHFTAKLLPGELAVEARTLDATDAADDRAMLHAVASVWEFPDYFSHNWDAADECLRDLDAWLPAKGYTMFVSAAARLWAEAPLTARRLVESWLLCAEDWLERGVPFHLVFRLDALRASGSAPA